MTSAPPLARSRLEWVRIVVAFGAIALIGIVTGAVGVLLPEQMAEFGVDKATIGLTFLTFSVGYVTTATANGFLVHRLGPRRHLILGTAVALLGAVGLTVPGGFAALLALQFVFGLGFGALDAGFNSYLSTLGRSAALLNYFHAFFGVGALLGPVIAAALVTNGFSWRVFFGLCAVAMVAQIAALLCYPVGAEAADTGGTGPARLGAAVRLVAVLLMAAFLGVYVGLESSVGNWAFSYLTQDRLVAEFAAGWIVSGYWFGLTLGRFTLNALAERIGLGLVALCALCIGGVGVAAVAAWVLPSTLAVTVGLVLVGYCLGPLFPLTIAIVPRLVPAELVNTSIGVLVATSVAGGAALPWLAGYLAQHVGLWTLMPWTAACAAVIGLIWWRISKIQLISRVS